MKTKPTAKLKKLLPPSQYEVTVSSDEFSDIIEDLNAKVETIPLLYSTEGNKHPLALHYFCGSSDWYIAEWDGDDLFFGYAILNGDLECAEWGTISLPELLSIPMMNLDYHCTCKNIEEIIANRKKNT